MAESSDGRRSTSIWDPHLVLSLTIPSSLPLTISDDAEELKREAKTILLAAVQDPPTMLCLIDAVQRLGVAHHFQQEIHQALHLLLPYVASDLFHASLQFRLLRQHAFPVSAVVFDKFRDVNGKFADNLGEDVAGLLSLYEASYLGFHGEQVLEEAKDFSLKHLKLLLSQEKLEGNIAHQVQQSLQLPLHWRMPRIEARNFITIYQQYVNAKHLALLDLAKWEYNIMHSLYLKELKEIAQWWTEVKLKQKLGFARDCLVECYFWAVGSVPEREFSKGRKNLAKYACLATALDDIYDVYGSLDDLKKFTHVISQWDIKAVEDLPDYLKVFYSTMVESADQAVRDASSNIDFMPYIKEQWASYCRALLVEAHWAREGCLPSFDDYLRNAWVSIGIPIGLVYSLLAQAHSIVQYMPGCLENWAHSELFYRPSLIARLHDDLTIGKDEIERGEPNALQCYMAQRSVSEEEAKARMRELIINSWTKLTELAAQGRVPNPLLSVAWSMTRCIHRIYHHGDWFGFQTQANQDCIIQHLLTVIH